MSTATEHITVCICTFRRPDLLRELLEKLDAVETEGRFTYSAVVVDNDRNGTALPAVEAFKAGASFQVLYTVEPEQNIALARNRAVENATGDYLAFIDDDEFPEERWLLNLYLAQKKYGCDGVLGPVRPFFRKECPRWVAKGNLCERKSHPTGTVMVATESRTGNVLFKRSVFADPEHRFEAQFGRTGGEDVWFFVRVMAKGYTFVWCEEAPVFETVPPERWKISYYFRRSVRMGGITGEEVKVKGLPGHPFPMVAAAACAYAAVLPVAALFGKHHFLRCLFKSAYHFAWLSGYFGRVPIRLRDD